MNIDNYQLPLHNPWWEASYNIDHDIKLVELADAKYKYEHPLLAEFPLRKDAVLTLRGPRRIGKTTLLKQIVRKLINNKTPRKLVFYYPCDRIVNFNELFFLLQNYIQEKRVETDKRLYLFLDEISFVAKWQRAVKSLADSGLLAKTTLLITGSNALDLKVSSERLPGRTGKYFNPDKLYLPLSFHDYFKLLNPDWSGKLTYQDNPKLKKYFSDYLLIGGFPHVINEYYNKNVVLPETYATYIKWIEGDIHKAGKSIENAYKLLAAIHQSLTSRTSFTKLAKKTALASQKTVQEYLELFELIFVIYKTDHFSLEQKRSSARKNKKFYFLDSFIHNAIIAKENGFLEDAFSYSKKHLLAGEQINHRIEEAVGANLSVLFDKFYHGIYGKNNLEIDFVGFTKGKYNLFEVKNSDSINLRPYKEILRKTKSYENLTLTSKSVEATADEIIVKPVHKFLAESIFAAKPARRTAGDAAGA